jgi:hypothetical protein
LQEKKEGGKEGTEEGRKVGDAEEKLVSEIIAGTKLAEAEADVEIEKKPKGPGDKMRKK